MEGSKKARAIPIWATNGHYQFLVEKGDYLGFAIAIRHLESGTAL
jgi:hypothetical protein